MTAVDVDALDKLRDRLAAVLLFDCGLTASAAEARAAVDKLWPVVDRIANERAAAELRAAAADYLANTAFLDPMREMRRGDVATDLMWRASTTRDRAAALRASNGEGMTT